MVGLDLLVSALPVSLAVLGPLYLAFTVWRGVNIVSRGASLVRMGVAVLVGVAVEGLRRTFDVSYGEAFDVLAGGVMWLVDVVTGFL